MIRQEILHYKIIEKGGMGAVYKAEDTKLKRDVAIKFLPRHIAANSDERERFKIEAQATAALNHPNIATIHAIEEADDEIFIVMEFMKRRESYEIVGAIRESPLPMTQIINIPTQIPAGLEAAHKHDMIYRVNSKQYCKPDFHFPLSDFQVLALRTRFQPDRYNLNLGSCYKGTFS